MWVATLAPASAMTPAHVNVVIYPATLTPSPTPGLPPSPTCLADITYPDDSHVSAGEAIAKVWRVKNASTCA